VVDHEIELAVGQDGVDPAEPFRGLWPGKERHDHADGQCPAEAKATSGRARSEAEFVHYGKDPVAGLGVNDLLPIERARGRRHAHTSSLRDVADRYRLLRHVGHQLPTETGY